MYLVPMSTAPPNRQPNPTISITGRNRAVSSASGLRTDSRRLRPARVSASDTSGLLRVSGEGEENVVQGGAAHGEAGDQAPVRVGRVEQCPYLGGGAVGRHADGQGRPVEVHRALAAAPGDLCPGGLGEAG